jgi:hypothetical protein
MEIMMPLGFGERLLSEDPVSAFVDCCDLPENLRSPVYSCIRQVHDSFPFSLTCQTPRTALKSLY